MANTRAEDRLKTSVGTEEAESLAGIVTAFERIAALGPQVLSLQGALLGGVVRSQRKEVDRLAATFGKEDERVARAELRVDLLDGLTGEAMVHATQVARFVDTVRKDGIFHGYVLLPDGSPAAGYAVVAAAADSGRKVKLRGKGKTDAEGYFSFNMAGAAQAAERTDIDAVFERMRTADITRSPAADTKDEGSTGTVTASAEVLDPTGRVVFEDPLPPTFDTMTSEFRIYSLEEAAPATDKPTMLKAVKPVKARAKK
jgi:hypothetical protein